MRLIHLLIGLQGRIGRGEFWLSVLIYFVFFTAVIGLAMIAAGSLTGVFGAAFLAYIPILVSSVFVGIKRLHDRNKSGWWLLAFYGIPIALQFVVPVVGGDGETESTGIAIMQYVGLAISLWGLIELGFVRGTIGANRYGPDPVAPKPAKH